MVNFSFSSRNIFIHDYILSFSLMSDSGLEYPSVHGFICIFFLSKDGFICIMVGFALCVHQYVTLLEGQKLRFCPFVSPKWSLDFKISLRPNSSALFQIFKNTFLFLSLSLSQGFLIFECLQIKLSVSKGCMRYTTTLSHSDLGSCSGFISLFLSSTHYQPTKTISLIFFHI